VSEFRSFDKSTYKRVLNMLKAIWLRVTKTVIERVTVVKFRVNDDPGNSNGSFEVKLWANAMKLADVRD